jgi:hypothetical protein
MVGDVISEKKELFLNRNVLLNLAEVVFYKGNYVSKME